MQYQQIGGQPKVQQQGQIKIIGNYSYNLRYCLGEGAYGKVYEGIETKTQKKIAIKKMDIKSFERDNYLRNQIISEIEILKRFNHRNIVQFIDLITTQRSLYIITEYCANGDLRQLMQQKRLPEDQCIKIFKHILEGFKELIKHGVIHRDLKPANILVHDGVFKIADFGFAKFVDYSSSQLLRSCVGSPLYMAPQILKRQQYGTKCDIWSLGVIFHEMVFHDVPWKARDERELLHNIMTQPFRIRSNIKVSKFTEQVLKQTLIIDEDKRISWDALFDMFKEHDYSQKMHIMPNVANKENIYNNPAQGQGYQKNSFNNNNQADSNKNKKNSIFEKQDTGSFLSNNTNDQKYSQLTKQEREKFEVMKHFMNLNVIRSEVMFRHYVCVDLLGKSLQNKRLMRTEINYSKLLFILAKIVYSQSFDLSKQARELKIKNEDFLKNSKELQELLNKIEKEDEYYRQFVQELTEQYRMSGIFDSLRNENDMNYAFQEIFTDSEKQALEKKIFELGKEVCKEIINKIKALKLEESLRGAIVSSDYIMDIILGKKKGQKGIEINYESFHTEKSGQMDLKHYFEKTNSKMSLFSTTFSFF